MDAIVAAVAAVVGSILSAITAITVCVINNNTTRKKYAQEQEQKDNERELREQKREEARREQELILIKSTGAAIALGEATAKAVQRIPDTHCNGDMHAALEYATKVKHEQRDFLANQVVTALYD